MRPRAGTSSSNVTELNTQTQTPSAVYQTHEECLRLVLYLFYPSLRYAAGYNTHRYIHEPKQAGGGVEEGHLYDDSACEFIDPATGFE